MEQLSQTVITFATIALMGFGLPVVGLLFAVLVRGLYSALQEDPAKERRARQLLAERYAKGELGREEFRQMGRDLSRSSWQRFLGR